MKVTNCDYSKRKITLEFSLDEAGELEYILRSGIRSESFKLGEAESLGSAKGLFAPMAVAFDVINRLRGAFKIATVKVPFPEVDMKGGESDA